jgi:hypothetical protein
MEPIIVEPTDLTQRRARADQGEFLLYDADFPMETDPRFAVIPPGPPLRWPHFSVGEVASMAFAGNLERLKRQLKGNPYKVATGQRKSHPLLLNGELLEFRSISRNSPIPPRRFTLADIERLAWALYQRNDIDGQELQRVSQIVLAVARQYWAHLPESGS